MCELLGMQLQCAARGSVRPGWGLVRKFVREWLQVRVVECVVGCTGCCVVSLLSQAS